MASSLSVKSSDHKQNGLFASEVLIHLISKISLSCSAPDSQAETAETPLQVNVPRLTSLELLFSFNFTSDGQQCSESRGIYPTLLRLNSVFPGVLNSK